MGTVLIPADGLSLAGRWYPGDENNKKAVIFSHGLFSTKDGYKITRLAEFITDAGFSLLTFDFRYAGESGEDISEISVLREVEDLAAVVSYVRDQGFEEVHLMGSSMGAAVTLLYCGRGGRADSLITIAAPVDLLSILPRMDREAARSLPEEGYTDIDGIKLCNSFFRELAAIDIENLLGAITAPLLAIHGARDTVVPPAQGEVLQARYGGKLRFVTVDDGDHNLTREEDIELLKGEVISWLRGAG